MMPCQKSVCFAVYTTCISKSHQLDPTRQPKKDSNMLTTNEILPLQMSAGFALVKATWPLRQSNFKI